MSETAQTHRAGAVGVSRARRRMVSPVGTTLIIIGFAVVFGLAGYLVSALKGTTYSVSAQVQAQPTPTLENSDPAPSTIDENDIFMQSQVETMSSVTGRLPAGSSVTISQVGLSSVLKVTASASAKTAAVEAANEVVQRYIALRNRQVSQYTANAQTQIDRQLQQDASELKAIDPQSPQAGAERSALEGDYGRLLTLKRQLSLSASTSKATNVIGHADLANVVQVSNNLRNAILAAVVGALIGVGVAVALRRSRVSAPTAVQPSAEPLPELAESR